MTAFANLIPDARAFFADLSQNNSRDWFKANKATYDDKLKTPALHLLDQIAARLQTTHGAAFTTKLFRPHRDVRFSKDKTPYTLHLHMLWTQSGVEGGPGWFFGISGDYVTAGWGWMGFSPAQLTRWRALIDKDETLPGILASTGMNLRAPELKRVPPPYDKDHPRGEFLRKKSLTLWEDLGDVKDIEAALMKTFAKIEPVYAHLRDAI